MHFWAIYVPVNSKTTHLPSPPPAIPGHLTRVKLRTVRNLTQNEARLVGHLTSVSKRLSVVGNKRILQFTDSACELRSQVIALVDSTWGFLLLSFYIVISWNMSLFKAWREDKLNMKFIVAKHFAELVSKGKRFCFPWRVGDLTLFEAVTGGTFDCLNWQHSRDFYQIFSKKSIARRGGGGDGQFWNWPVHYI